MISKLYAAHQAGEKTSGFDIEGEGAAVKDVAAAGILDLYLAKYWGLKLATDAATTVLRVDQVSLFFFGGGGLSRRGRVDQVCRGRGLVVIIETESNESAKCGLSSKIMWLAGGQSLL